MAALVNRREEAKTQGVYRLACIKFAQKSDMEAKDTRRNLTASGGVWRFGRSVNLASCRLQDYIWSAP